MVRFPAATGPTVSHAAAWGGGRGLVRAAFVIGALWAGLALWAFPKWTVDDAYISFRYAENLALRGELNWNVGEDPVEGYTGIALPLALAGVLRFGGSPVLASQLIGVVALFAGAWLLGALLRRLGVAPTARGLVTLLYFGAPLLYTHALSGLETLLFTTAVTGCLLALVVCLETPAERRGVRESVLMAALLLTSLIRPEGVILAASSTAALGYQRWKTGRRPLLALLARAVLLFLIPGAGYFLWRWTFYGLLLPNTFYAKSPPLGINPDVAQDLALFVLTYFGAPLFAALLPVLADPEHVRENLREGWRRIRLAPFSWMYLAAGVFVGVTALRYLRMRLGMDYSFRMFVPYFPIGLLSIGLLVQFGIPILESSWTQRPRRSRLVAAAILVALGVQGLVYLVQLRREAYSAGSYQQLIMDEHIPAGKYLRDVVPGSEWLAVVSDAGAVPYFSGLKTVDFGRLNDEVLARSDFSPAQVADYFFSFDAGAAVFTSFDWEHVRFAPPTEAILTDPRFEHYVLARKFRSSPETSYYLFVFLRRDLETPSDGDSGQPQIPIR